MAAFGPTLDEDYKALCTEMKVKCNSAVVKQLEGKDTYSLTSWDLSANAVGTRGATVVLALVAKSLPDLKSINLAGNNLASNITTDLYKTFVNHANITSINVSNNDIRLGGPALVDLVKRNKKIATLNIEQTFLRPLFERLVSIHLGKNNAAKGEAKQQKFTFGDMAEDGQSDGAASDGGFGGGFGNFGDGVQFVSGAGAGGGKKVPRRATVCAEVYQEDEIENFTPEVIEKDEKTRLWMYQVLERHDLFCHLEDFELYVAIDAMNDMTREKGDTIFDEGDEDGDTFYLIASGEVTLTMNDELLETLSRGSTTQDLMLMYGGEYRETCQCTEDSQIFSLDRRTYSCILAKASKKKRAMYEGFLSEVRFLSCLEKSEVLQLADALKPASYEPGAKLIRHGETGETFFLIVEGIVDVFGRNDAGESIKVCEFTAGDCVGELEFLQNHKCVADVSAQGPVRTAKMNRHHFELVMGPVKDVLARNAEDSPVFGYYREQLEKMKKDE